MAANDHFASLLFEYWSDNRIPIIGPLVDKPSTHYFRYLESMNSAEKILRKIGSFGRYSAVPVPRQIRISQFACRSIDFYNCNARK